ncbi:MAG: acetyl-CoA carboxylase, carboxyltransferase subunit beta [Bacteroidia bacterium]|nr:acetyl-CoA carboxylase, carboxyltransferase subunit beta [Bacteroidia bacterium]MCF8427400.1 acetyl-CoA carboxylase, carboxyltransferase subunit beta [Bacteroidia bacterium]MCF8446124.1 acetyl-CoA carboxylase, carboxyltransferase subunit beta [Bacteroidia bacterium]
MSWYKRVKEGITTLTSEKKSVPDGLWHKCSRCKKTFLAEDHNKNGYVCLECNYHDKIGSHEYFEILFGADFTELFENIMPSDPLKFTDTKDYATRLKDSQDKSGMTDAMRVALGNLSDDMQLVVACMDFGFIGGSMGSVVGEKISRAIDYSRENRIPLLIISKSGGARMMEAAFSLMQMAKTSAKLALLGKAGIPYVSLLTDPTTGGVTASFAMLGDVNIAEPEALIGFAGPRVIRETIGKDLPKGFQSSEFVLEHGFLDFIVNRNELRGKLNELLHHMMKTPFVKTEA